MTPHTHERRSRRLLPNVQALILAGMLALLLLPSLPTVAISSGVDIVRIIAATNAARARANLPSVHVDALLSEAAHVRAEELARSGALAHVRPDGSSFALAVRASAYPYERVAENLAIDFFTTPTIVDAWLASPSHRRNILGAPYRDIGIGVAHTTLNGKPTMIVVQILGRARPVERPGWYEATAAIPLS